MAMESTVTMSITRTYHQKWSLSIQNCSNLPMALFSYRKGKHTQISFDEQCSRCLRDILGGCCSHQSNGNGGTCRFICNNTWCLRRRQSYSKKQKVRYSFSDSGFFSFNKASDKNFLDESL